MMVENPWCGEAANSWSRYNSLPAIAHNIELIKTFTEICDIISDQGYYMKTHYTDLVRNTTDLITVTIVGGKIWTIHFVNVHGLVWADEIVR